jgi:hypothetical protein
MKKINIHKVENHHGLLTLIVIIILISLAIKVWGMLS